MSSKGRKGRLFVVSGPSGVGKSSIIERFLRHDGNVRFSVSYTTRKMRPRETEGKDYYFVDEARFRNMVDEDRFLEWESVHTHSYGTPRKEVGDTLRQGIDMVLDIDVKGALRVKEGCPEACLIFVEPPSRDELVRRLAARGEKELDLRMKRVDEELAQRPFFNYTIMNDNLDKACDEFVHIVDVVRRTNGKDNG